MRDRSFFRGMGTRGFTLIELVIVLVIIGMLAAIVVQKLDKVPTQADSAANMMNINELNKFMQLHSTYTGMVPDGLDTLTDTSNNIVYGNWGSDITTTSPPQTVIDLLNSIGIENVHQDGDISGDGLILLDTGVTLAKLDTPSDYYLTIGGKRISPGDSSLDYYVLGVGPYVISRSKVALQNIATCPLVKEDTTLPTQPYNHYLLVVEVDISNNAAEYLGFVDPLLESATEYTQ